jgi:hypothetical protein
MGEVYRTRDPRMGRDVAIKISSERFSDCLARRKSAADGSFTVPRWSETSKQTLPSMEV